MVASSTVTPRHNSSPFVPPECSPGPGIDGTPNQRRSRSVTKKTQRPRSSLTTEQVVPSTPNQQTIKDNKFSTPNSTPRRPHHSQYVSMETLQRSRSQSENRLKNETKQPDVIIIDQTGDHHHSSTRKVQKGQKRELVARQRKSLISRGGVKTRLTSDFLDDIGRSDK